MKFLTFLLALASGLDALSQSSGMVAEGKVLDAKTNKAIKAYIRYCSMPTGSIYGRFNDSTFSFPIYGDAKYQITAQADGYLSKTVLIDPRAQVPNPKISKVIRLIPKGSTLRLSSLNFQQGSATIDPQSFRELDDLTEMMEMSTSMTIQLEGHTETHGSASANLKLSEKRVLAVKRYLVQAGISKKRIKTKAYGGTKPVRQEFTPEDRAMNRRVEMRILTE